MSKLRVLLIVAVCLAAVWAAATRTSTAGIEPSGYVYAQLVLPTKGIPRLIESEQTTEIQPPAGVAGGAVRDTGRATNAYTGRTIDVRSVTVGALNYASSLGWEVVSIENEETGQVALLRRPY